MKMIKSDLKHRINEILFDKWDPIGIKHMPGCYSPYEYIDYADEIFFMIDKGGSIRRCL